MGTILLKILLAFFGYIFFIVGISVGVSMGLKNYFEKEGKNDSSE